MRLELLGPLQLVTQKRSSISGICAQALGLLAILQENSGVVQRSRLAGKLWPDVPERQARRALNQVLYRLRQLLSDSAYLKTDKETVQLLIDTDLREFRTLLQSPEPQDQQQALELYRGDFLSGEDASWLEPYRLELKAQYLESLRLRCLDLATQTTATEAIPLARRWVRHDPLNEEAQAILIQCYIDLGHYSSALKHYQRFAEQLELELDARPRPETSALIEQLQADKQTAQAQADQLVGRAREWHSLSQALQQLKHQQGKVILIEGEAGMGKTSLLDKLKHTAQQLHFHLAYSDVSSLATQLSPLDSALQELTRGQRLARWTCQLSPIGRDMLRPLLPRLGQTMAASPLHPRAMSMALEQLLIHVTKECPLVIMLDNMHRAEALCWHLLSLLAEKLARLPVLIILAHRPFKQNDDIQDFYQQLLCSPQGQSLTLKGLSQQDAHSLIKHWQLTTADWHRYWMLSRGNPYIFKMLLHHQEDSGSLKKAFETRLADLSVAAREALEVASVVGNSIHVGLWQSLHQKIPFAELEQRQLIQEDAEGYRFDHELLRQHLYETLSEAKRRHYHQRVAQLLRFDAVPAEQLAWHLEKADNPEDARQAYLEASKQALSRHDYAQARYYCSKVETLATDAKTMNYQTTLLNLSVSILKLHIGLINKRSSEKLSEIINLEAQASALKDDDSLFQLGLLHLDAISRQGDMVAIQTLGQRLLQLSQDLGSPERSIEALLSISNYMMDSSDKAQALAYARDALELAEQHPQNPFWKLRSYHLLTEANIRCKDEKTARHYLEKAHALLQKYPEFAAYDYQLKREEAMLLWIRGDIDQAIGCLDQALEASQELADDLATLNTLQVLGHICLFSAQFETAAIYYERCLSHLKQHRIDQDAKERYFCTARLAECYVYLEDWQQAGALLDSLDTWLSQARGEAATEALYVKAVFHLEQDRHQEAKQSLERIIDLAGHDTSMNVIVRLLWLEACWHLGEHDRAQQGLQRIDIATLSKSELPYYYHSAFLIEQRPIHLALAYKHLLDFAKRYHNRLREDYLHRPPVHRRIMLWWNEARARGQTVTLVSEQLPLGSTISAEDRLEVLWTVNSDDDLILEQHGKVALRHHRLQRLVTEARAQGAAPSYADLAKALQVSERTIERDAQMLTKAGIQLATRGAKETQAA